MSTQPTPILQLCDAATKGPYALDNFCADAIRKMRGMKSFAGLRIDTSSARIGRARALHKFYNDLHAAFPKLTERELSLLTRFAKDRALGLTPIETASLALLDGHNPEAK